MEKLLGLVRAAVDHYGMIEEGDRIAAAVSGGGDSLALLWALARLRDFYPKRFELLAVTLDHGYGNTDGNYSEIQKLCDGLGVEYVVRRTELWKLIFEDRKEKNPCALCARMRRGILHNISKEHGCNRVALGHHADDAAETFLMNLLSGGTLSCFSPVTYLSRKALYVIRPLVFAHKSDVQRAVRRLALPVVESGCPADGRTNREEMKKLLAELEKRFPGLRGGIVGALQRAHLDNW